MRIMQSTVPRFGSVRVEKHSRNTTRDLIIRVYNDEKGNHLTQYQDLLAWSHNISICLRIKTGSEPSIELKKGREYIFPSIAQLLSLRSLLGEAEFKDADAATKKYGQEYQRELTTALTAKVRASLPEEDFFQALLALLRQAEQGGGSKISLNA